MPHLVPVTFVLEGRTVWWAVDSKPKRTSALQRLVNIRNDARVSLLADHYEDDWTALWWVRADGVATICSGADADNGARLLADRYIPYQASRPQGPVVKVEVRRWQWWSARPFNDR